jgi:signal transduction histidine kinase
VQRLRDDEAALPKDAVHAERSPARNRAGERLTSLASLAAGRPVPAGETPPAASALSEDSAIPSSALHEEVQSTYEYLPAILLGMLALAAVVVVLFWRVAPRQLLLPWLAAFLILAAARLVMLVAYRRALRERDVDWAAWRNLWSLTTVAAGVLWGATAWFFYPHGSPVQQTGLILAIYSYCIASVPVLAQRPGLFVAFAALCFVPMIGRIALGAAEASVELAGELLMIVSLTTVLSRSFRHALQRITQLKLRTDALLVQLRAEKLAADTARQEAEVANRAKTQFFTAASHDLRQPLHAMGLFAEALRQRTHGAEAAQLVNSINESVDALEGLFSELLDISRIDSGGVEVRTQDFVIGDLLRKLKLHFEPAAFEKGLALRLRGHRHAVRGDPLLVERILRNLVSNAVRYTQDGSVLVSARRRGDQVLLQVWDTGVGIGKAEQSRVFEEFYQVQTRREPSPDQRKGLGLGLAIVQRLAGLMGAPLRLRSEAGRGTVFTLELPIGKPNAVVPPPRDPKFVEVTLAGRLIVLVEDEPAVRAGLEVLLRDWGAAVLAFESASALEAWVADPASASSVPSLAIVDYRLEPERTGIEAIGVLRGRFGADLPAVVVTGSTMIDHGSDAQTHDFHVLLKPVLPNKLRAMIAFKLAASRPASPSSRED